MSTDLAVNPEEFGLEKESVVKIEEAFTPKIAEREALAKIYAELITKDIDQNTIIEAGDLRNKLVKVRTGIAAVHKTQKAFFLASGRFVDAWKNKETLPVSQMEEKLMEIEKFFENQEKERKQKIQKKRADILSAYVTDAHERELAEMDDDVWAAYLTAKKQAHEDQLEAEKKAEENRKAQEEEDKRKRQEAEDKLAEERKKARQLKMIRDERAEELRPYLTFIRDYESLISSSERKYKTEFLEIKKGYEIQQAQEKAKAAEKAKKDAELALELKIRDEQAKKERLEREKKAKEEKERADKLQAELDAKKEAEEKAKREEAERLENELTKGDEEKIKDLINDLETITTKYEFKAPKNVDTYEAINSRIYAIVKHLKETN